MFTHWIPCCGHVEVAYSSVWPRSVAPTLEAPLSLIFLLRRGFHNSNPCPWVAKETLSVTLYSDFSMSFPVAQFFTSQHYLSVPALQLPCPAWVTAWGLVVQIFGRLVICVSMPAAGSIKQMWRTNGLDRWSQLGRTSMYHRPSNQSRHESNCQGLNDYLTGT